MTSTNWFTVVEGPYARRKFWQNFTSDKLQRAAQFPQVLIYLKLCSRSAVLDAKRRQAATLLPDDDPAGADPSPPPDERFVDGEQRASFWMPGAAAGGGPRATP